MLRKIDIVQFEPNIGAAVRYEIGQLANYLRVENWFGLGRVKDRQRNAPTALTRNDPVGTRFDRASDPILAPRRNPFHFVVNCFQRFAAEIVDPNKKLFDVAKDDRRLGAPAIRIGVMKILRA